MNGWFLAIIILKVLAIGINLAKHGQVKETEKYSFWGALFGSGIMLTLIYFAIKAGF